MTVKARERERKKVDTKTGLRVETVMTKDTLNRCDDKMMCARMRA